MAAAAAQEGSGRGTDTRLNQETARWLQWDKVRGDRGWDRLEEVRGPLPAPQAPRWSLRFLPAPPIPR